MTVITHRLGAIAAFISLTLITGCKIEIQVPSGGEVTTQSGSYNCAEGEVCEIDVSDTHFDEVFSAVPNSGSIFTGWKKQEGYLCGGKSTQCPLSTTSFAGHDALVAILESDTVFYLQPMFANTWERVGENIPGETFGDLAGTSVVISSDGNRIAVGAPGNTGTFPPDSYDVGHVRGYAWSGTAWKQLGKDIDGDEEFALFGSSLSLSANGNRLAVGAPGADDNGSRSGHVQVYKWTGTRWKKLGRRIKGEAAYDYLGSSVSLSANGFRLAIGAKGNSAQGYRSGKVKVFKWSNNNWTQLGPGIAGKSAGELSGYSVSLSAEGDRVAIGAIDNGAGGDSAGAARVYKWTGKSWKKLGNDMRGEAAYDWFGVSVSLSANGKRLAVGSGQGDYVRVYLQSANRWGQVGQDIRGNSTGKFGSSVSLSANGKRLAIGDYRNTDNGHNAGQVQLYAWSNQEWRQLLENMNGELKSQAFGYSVSLSGTGQRVAVGAPLGGATPGYAGVYEMAYSDDPKPPVDPMKVYLLSPHHTETVPQNNPETGCTYDPVAGYGLRFDFDWSNAISPEGIAGYHLKVITRYGSRLLIDTFVTNSDYTWISCASYANNIAASAGYAWSVQAEDKQGTLGPLNDEGYFNLELCRLDNGEFCGF